MHSHRRKILARHALYARSEMFVYDLSYLEQGHESLIENRLQATGAENERHAGFAAHRHLQVPNEVDGHT